WVGSCGQSYDAIGPMMEAACTLAGGLPSRAASSLTTLLTTEAAALLGSFLQFQGARSLGTRPVLGRGASGFCNVVVNSTISHNTSTGDGGAFACASTLWVVNSTVSGNQAAGNGFSGSRALPRLPTSPMRTATASAALEACLPRG